MKRKGVLTAALLMFFAVSFAAPGEFEVEIKPEFIKPSVVSYSKAPRVGNLGRQEFDHEWLMISVHFKCDSERAQYSKRRHQSAYAVTYKKEWMDNVQLELRMVIDTNETGATNHRNSSNRFVGMTGATEFWTINTNEKNHVTRFYVPAQLLDRYVYSPSHIRAAQKQQPVKVKQRNQTIKLKQIYIEAIFKYQGQVIGSGYYNIKKNKRSAVVFNQKISECRSHMLKNAILPRLLSPWALYYPEHYDVEKVPGY